MRAERPLIALVAGEASGDQLGAPLIERLRTAYPDAEFVGIGGRKMKAAGLTAWWDCDELAVFGLFEVLAHFPRLLKLRRALTRRLRERPPDVFIGIDSPDFNLGLEIALRRQGIRTVHYVSPTVWAWREKRVQTVKRAADLVLCLFPFEPDIYEEHDVDAVFVGHPMADAIRGDEDRTESRRALGMDPGRPTIALLPGSRISEVSRLAEPMVDAARLLRQRTRDLQFVSAMANEATAGLFERAMEKIGFDDVLCIEDNSLTVMAAADVVICASGTASLEAMLLIRPLVATYRVAPATYHAFRGLRLIRPQCFAMPNILAGETLAPELIQHDANGPRMALEAAAWLEDEERRAALERRYRELSQTLRRNAAARAAESIAELLERENEPAGG